jgi:sulfide:quinone oxidoreductase
MFGGAKYCKTLEKHVVERGIQALFRHNLISLNPEKKEATFEHLETKEKRVMPYDMIHVTPPMSAPDFIKSSPLANADGWVEVDKETLRHTRFPNVFGLGDASSLPTSKTGASVRKQALALVANLLAVMSGKLPTAKYDGYTSCPIPTARGRLVLAEFDYNGTPCETFPSTNQKNAIPCICSRNGSFLNFTGTECFADAHKTRNTYRTRRELRVTQWNNRISEYREGRLTTHRFSAESE